MTRALLLVLIMSVLVAGDALAASGLHFTQDEVDIWATRAASGPYKTAGDVRQNSPGDWDRIIQHKNSFMNNPNSYVKDLTIWAIGCILSGDNGVDGTSEVRTASRFIRDAAFYSLVMDDDSVRAAVKPVLLEYTDNIGMQFSDRGVWCYEKQWDYGETFAIAHIMSALLFAYDYLGRDYFSEGEQEKLDAWHYSFADLLNHDSDVKHEKPFANRYSDNYSLINEWTEHRPISWTHPETYMEKNGNKGPIVGEIHNLYNNRWSSMMRYVAEVGVHQNNLVFKDHAKRYGKEFIRFGWFPQGAFTDFHRFDTNNPENGFQYSSLALAEVIEIADVLARSGDSELFEYSTIAGAHGSEGVPDGEEGKSLLWAAKTLARYCDQTYDRYGTNNSQNAGNSEYRIDCRNPDHGGQLRVAAANVYYKNNYIKGMLLGTGANMPSYESWNWWDVWNGPAGIFPGQMFMFGQMEGKVWPYGDIDDGLQPPISPEITSVQRH